MHAGSDIYIGMIMMDQASCSTWLTAIGGAAILLLAYHPVTSRTRGRSRSSGRGSQRSRGWAHQ